jgi:Flp pilus assembly protein TadG
METALTLPLLLLVSVGIFEFGRAYQTWQVLTNAAREGARLAIVGTAPDAVQARVKQYMTDGQIGAVNSATVTVDANQTIAIGGTATATATKVTVAYPFSFIVLNPVARLVSSSSTLGGAFTMSVSAVMRNEVQ